MCFTRLTQPSLQENLDGIMALYATQYNYHGLKQADIRKIWLDLFKEYRNLVEVHFFSKIVKVGSGSNAIIEVTCTGSLVGPVEDQRPPGANRQLVRRSAFSDA